MTAKMEEMIRRATASRFGDALFLLLIVDFAQFDWLPFLKLREFEFGLK